MEQICNKDLKKMKFKFNFNEKKIIYIETIRYLHYTNNNRLYRAMLFQNSSDVYRVQKTLNECQNNFLMR